MFQAQEQVGMAAEPRASVFVIVIILVAAFSTWTDCAIARSRTRTSVRHVRIERSDDNQNVDQSCVEGLFNRTNCTGSNQLSSFFQSGETDDSDEDEQQIRMLLLFVETTASSGEYNLNTNESLIDVCLDPGGVCQPRYNLFCRFNLAKYVANPAGRSLKLEVHSAGQRQLVCQANLSDTDSLMITESEFTVEKFAHHYTNYTYQQ